MAAGSLLPVFLLIGVSTAWVEERPTLESRDGNLVIASAKDRNITLLTSGKSAININDINLIDVSENARQAARVVENWKNGYLDELTTEFNRIVKIVEGHPNGLEHKVNEIQSRVYNMTNSSMYGGDQSLIDSIPRLHYRFRILEREVQRMRTNLEINACIDDPCKNGGTCIRIYGGMQCLCPSNYEGPNCAEDVNECVRYTNTDLGCQNGATCRNLPGSYRCDCAPGWHGIHCISKTSVCDAEDSRELCGNGNCVSSKRTPLGYTCTCDQGWQSEGTDPACRKDVDECAGNHPPCSMNPLVQCVNFPGGYTCGACPAGYTGTGYYCSDIDECLVNNGGCSVIPSVQCINTLGSRICGPCPIGYEGNGMICTYVGACRINNGGCHQLATCVENPRSTNLFVQCNCPPGYHGNGMGPQGCRPGYDSIDPCSSNPCVHGTCEPNGSLYRCRCNAGFTGTQCENHANPCTPNPCQNEGICQSTDLQTFTCKCTDKFSGPRCETPRQSCGGYFANPSGSITYPLEGQSYESDLSCAFIIHTNNASTVLNITLTRFDFEHSSDCNHNFLEIRDGPNSDAPLMKRYCGSRLPSGRAFRMNHNSVHLYLHTDKSISRGGFALNWNSVLPICGGTLNKEYGTIKSPGSPGNYPHNRDCFWHIIVRPGKRIQFHFVIMQIEEHPTCEHDYLEINETAGDREIQLNIYCNHSHPAPIRTSGSFAKLHFHSDSAGSDVGFIVSYSTVTGIPGCGDEFTADSGIITSPGFPSDFPPNVICEYKIRLPKGEKIHLTWMDFEMENHRFCAWDSVTIFNGSDTESPRISKLCGNRLPEPMPLDTNVVVILFTSDWSNAFKGFRLKYETICGGKYHAPSGEIKSPYYPNNYPASRTCIYEIIQPPGKGIIFEVFDMRIEISYRGTCSFDGLYIYDGDNENSTRLDLLCGRKSSGSHPYYSTYNFMYLKFMTDSSIHHNRGFWGNYTTYDRGCGGLIREPVGIIQSPNDGTEGISNFAGCTWILKAPKGHIIKLTFTSFNVDSRASCYRDFIDVYDGANVEGVKINRYCGPRVPYQTPTTQTESMTIVFPTRRIHFAAHYMFIDISKDCGAHYVTPTGTIMSPNHPGNYPPNKNCVWFITVTKNHLIDLEVEVFDLEPPATWGERDYLELRNGGYETSPLLDKYSGSKMPRHLKSFTNQLYFKFVSNRSVQHRGFKIKWSSSTTGCGGRLIGFTGEITSPNYPQNYPYLADCTWTIAVALGSKVRITIVDVDLENRENCRYSYIEVSTGAEQHKKTGKKYCNRNHPAVIEVDSNEAAIRFRSGRTSAGRGFYIKYISNCVNTIRGFHGVIVSPNFPNPYPDFLNCTWTIEAPKGNTINITFSHLELNDGAGIANCSDYLDIREGSGDVAYVRIKKLCGSSNLPDLISTAQRKAFLNFVTNAFGNANGFRLEWTIVGCGGHLKRPSGVIRSPGYPHPYPRNIECEWLIEVEYDHSVEITFLDMNTERRVGCETDKVILYGGSDANAPKLKELCHADDHVVVTSPTNKLFVKFESDVSFAGRGFDAEYKSVALTCGGKFKGDDGAIHTANYPQNYPNNANCEWLIEVDKNHVVNLTFTDFDIEAAINCTADYVKIFDGPTRDAMEYGPYCKSNMPPPIISSGNSILVVLRSDSLLTSKGFEAKYFKTCGAHIIADGDGVLETSSLHHMGSVTRNCTWIITAKDDADHVTLTFFHIDLTARSRWDTNCRAHYVSVYEGDGVDGPSRGRWCSNKTPPPITSSGRSLTVQLYAVYNFMNDRFGATYSVLDSACGGDRYSASGTISSPTYPNSYPINVECIWVLKTSPGNGITLTFSEFDLESDPHCDRDYLEIREESGTGRLIDTYCTGLPGPITSPKSLWVKFRSDESGVAKGFLAEYALLINGNELTGVKGEISSPLYPYSWNKKETVTWRITVGFRMTIRVEIDDLHLEDYGDCTSHLTFYDGYDAETPKLMTVCGLIKPIEPIISTSNVVFVELSSNYYREGNWFHLHWYQSPKKRGNAGKTVTKLSDCEVEYDLTLESNRSVTFNSPGYPDGYARNLDCTWVFTSPPGYHLILRFINIHLEETKNCDADYITVSNGNGLSTINDDSPILRKACFANDSWINIAGKDVMTVKFHSDSWINETGFQATVRRVCGGELRSPNGMIDFNETMTIHDPSDYYYICEWNITVKNGKTIKITITDFVVENKIAPFCSDPNYLMLRNGAGRDSPPLGVGIFCDTASPPGDFETTGNKLYVKAVGIRSKLNFKMAYSEKGMSCGGSFLLDDSSRLMELSSPNYPNIPPSYSECFWTYMAPAGERLTLHFVGRFDLTSSKDCTTEYVEVRDGGTENAPLVDRYCGETAPSSISATGNMVYIHFYTELADPKNGFKAKVTMGLCGEIRRGNKGVIHSPNYPEAYPINQQCSWTIIGPVDHTLKLEFTDFHLPHSRRCDSGNVVTISEPYRNSTSDTIQMVKSYGPFCGMETPDVITTSSNEVVISFNSNNRTNMFYRGFRLNYTASKDVCGGTLTSISGEFYSVGYPNPSKATRTCQWVIEVPIGSQVMLEILDLDLPTEVIGRIGEVFIAFWNDKMFRSQIAVFQKLPYLDKIYSTSNIMSIYLVFDSGRRGFRGRFTAVAPAPCGGVVNDAKGALLPPDMPYNASTYYCKWELKAPETMIDSQNQTGITSIVTVSGSIGSDYTRASKYCDRSTKFIRVNGGMQNAQSVCGNITGEPFIIRSPTPSNTIEVINGTFGKGTVNFDMQYEWKACGGILTGPSHTISSPRNVTYPISCVWYARYDDPSAIIFMKFNRLNLGSCDKGYISVRNGGRMAPELHKFCGNLIDRNITSSTNQLWIEYWTAKAPGDFEFQLDSEGGSCGGVYRGTNKEISSPNFPKSYPNNAECTWEITVDPGYTIGLSFIHRFSMEMSVDCANDFVQTFDWVYDKHGVGKWKDNQKYCGRNPPTPVNSTSTRMKILFRSNAEKQGDGFRAMWEQNCGGQYEAKAYDQYISSPHYPSEYPPDLKCTYIIVAPEDKPVWVEFVDFELEGKDPRNNCALDRVMISSTHRYFMRRRKVLCGNDKPDIINSFTAINITFESDPYVEKRGFRFRYFYNECGGDITEPTEISSPSHKNGRYFGHLNCTWVIRAPEGKSVILRLEKFDLETNWRCKLDKLMVVEGDTLEGNVIMTLCGNATDPATIPIKTIGNAMTVMFKSDSSNEYGGMKAAIIFTRSEASGCGGDIQLQNSKSFRTQSTAMYEPLEDCQWTVTAESGKFVQLTINQMDVKNATNATNVRRKCTGDFLEIRDGGSAGVLLDRYCGNVRPQHPVTSITNVLWIRFFTDSTLEGEGVSATLAPIDSACGKQMWDITNETVIFESPGYPSDFQPGIRCRWAFKRIGSYAPLRLHFENLDMEDTENCDGDHLAITDDVSKYILQDFGQNFIFNGRRTRPHLYSMRQFSNAVTYKYCGQASKFDYHSNSHEIHVTLKTTAGNVSKPRKFKFDVSPATCNRNYTAEQGRIIYENAKEVFDCWTTITAPPNYTISAYFTKFRIYDRANCSGNFLKIHYGDFQTPPIQTLCGTNPPNPIFSTGNVLSIRAKTTRTSYTTAACSYDFVYTTTDKGRGCGGKLFNYRGAFTSPMYPHNYRNASNCLWEISVPRGFQVVLEFDFFDLGTADICATNYLQVKEMKKDGGREEVYCPGIVPATFRATTNVVNVIYSTSSNNGGAGWKIRFKAVQSPDVGIANEDWQRPMSPND